MYNQGVLEMKNTFILSILILTSFLAAEWTNISPDSSIIAADFISANEGWAYQRPDSVSIYHTTDAGINWDKIYSLEDPLAGIYSIDMIDSLNGWLSMSADFDKKPTSGISFMRTTNGGHSWENMTPFMPTTAGYHHVPYFINKNLGFCTGTVIRTSKSEWYSLIFKTIDGGFSWSETNIHESVNVASEGRGWSVNKFYFVDETHGWAACTSYHHTHGGIFISTNDGGNTWVSNIDYDLIEAVDVHFTDPLNGAVITNDSNITSIGITDDNFTTSTLSNNWTYFDQGYIFCCHFQNDTTIWAAGVDGIILRSKDRGLTYSQLYPSVNYEGSPPDYQKIQFFGNTGYIIGNNNSLLKYEESSGIVSDEEQLVDNYHLSNHPNPFNPSTTISYHLPETAEMNITVINARGEHVWSTGNKRQEAGSYSINFDGSVLNSGIYFFSLSLGGNVVQTQKMMLLK